MTGGGPFDRTDVASTDGGPGVAGYLGNADGAAPRVGDAVDRYQLIALLGAGAMGVVFRATDSDLQRDVALKLLRGAHGDAAARARLLDEARAMARLHHPGVVAVYDVGTAGGHDFVAMELIAGTTLAEWMQPRRPWREVVTRFVAAGRGLAAAHAAGVIHRDFKPHNVLCGDDGRVAVADFGLALLSTGEPDAPDGGGIAGTPAYMAPEQHAGATVDARTDQFAFCVALFEGVFGVRPFVAPTLAALREAIGRGATPPTGGPRVPARLRRAILRGLAVDPAARHRDLPTLLAELTAILGARRRALVSGAVGLAAIAAVATAAAATRDDAPAPPSCAATRFAPTWPGAARARVAAALAATPDAQRSVLDALDGYAARWDTRWTTLCAAERDDAPAFHAVAGCLLDGRAQAAALIDELPRVSPTTQAAAVLAVEQLPAPDGCTPGHVATLPADPALRARVRELEAKLAELRGRAAAPPADRRAAATALVDAARATGHRPLLAAALGELASIDVDAGDLAAARAHLGEGALVAEEAGAADVRAQLLVVLAELEASYSSDPIVQGRAARQAAAALDAEPAAPQLRARLLVVQARLAQAADHPTEALAFVDEAIALRERAGARVAAAGHVALRARILRSQGQAAAALTAVDAALARALAAAGPDCGPCEALRFEAAFALHDLGRYAEAQARVDEALRYDVAPLVAPGPRRITGRVVDRARRPVAGADVIAIVNDLRGDPAHLVQPHDRLMVAQLAVRAITDADGRFELHVGTAPLLVIGELPAVGRTLPGRLRAGTDATDLTLHLEPWATIGGEVTGVAPDAHVHLTADVAADHDVALPSYRVEVPVVDGRWSARVPAVPHSVRLVRSDVRFETTLAVASAAPRAGGTVTVALARPGDVELEVRVRGDRAIEVPHAGVLLFSGHRAQGTIDGLALMTTYLGDRGTSRATETASDGEGGSAVTLTAVTPGPYTLCAVALPGDMHDPTVRTRVMAHPELLEGPCRHVTVAATPARQAVTLDVPPPRRLPE